jgi:hypothetical protein
MADKRIVIRLKGEGIVERSPYYGTEYGRDFDAAFQMLDEVARQARCRSFASFYFFEPPPEDPRPPHGYDGPPPGYDEYLRQLNVIEPWFTPQEGLESLRATMGFLGTDERLSSRENAEAVALVVEELKQYEAILVRAAGYETPFRLCDSF